MITNKSISYLLCNKGIIVNLYKLHFLSSHFSFQPNKKVFHSSTFSSLQPKHNERKLDIFYPLFFTLPLIFHPPIFLLLQSTWVFWTKDGAVAVAVIIFWGLYLFAIYASCNDLLRFHDWFTILIIGIVDLLIMEISDIRVLDPTALRTANYQFYWLCNLQSKVAFFLFIGGRGGGVQVTSKINYTKTAVHTRQKILHEVKMQEGK